MRNVSMILVVAAMTSALVTGCNTMEGVGKDMKAAGEKIEGAAKKSDARKDDGEVPAERSSEKY